MSKSALSRILMSIVILIWIDTTILFANNTEQFTNWSIRIIMIDTFVFSQTKKIMIFRLKFMMHFSSLKIFMLINILTFRSFTRWNFLRMCAILDSFLEWSWKYKSSTQYFEVSCVFDSMSRTSRLKLVRLISTLIFVRNFRSTNNMNVFKSTQNSWNSWFESKSSFTRAY